jgi:hypothetical protein
VSSADHTCSMRQPTGVPHEDRGVASEAAGGLCDYVASKGGQAPCADIKSHGNAARHCVQPSPATWTESGFRTGSRQRGNLGSEVLPRPWRLS